MSEGEEMMWQSEFIAMQSKFSVSMHSEQYFSMIFTLRHVVCEWQTSSNDDIAAAMNCKQISAKANRLFVWPYRSAAENLKENITDLYWQLKYRYLF